MLLWPVKLPDHLWVVCQKVKIINIIIMKRTKIASMWQKLSILFDQWKELSTSQTFGGTFAQLDNVTIVPSINKKK